MGDDNRFYMGSFDWSVLFNWDELYELAKTDIQAYEKKRREIFTKYLTIIAERGTKEEMTHAKRLLERIEKSRPSGDNLGEICLNIGQSLAEGINGSIKTRTLENSAKEEIADINKKLLETQKQSEETLTKLKERNAQMLNALPIQGKYLQ